MYPLAQTIPASVKIGSFFPWNWLIDRSPGWAFLIMLFISPVCMMFVLHPWVEGRMVRLSDHFLTFKLDVMFAPTLALGLVLVGAMDNHVYVHHSALRDVVQLLILLGWVAFGFFHAYQERHDYLWGQRLSPSALYHNVFLFGFTGYALTMVCGMGLLFAPWSFQYVVLRVVMLVCIGTWAAAWPLYDEHHKTNAAGESKYEYAHVNDGWPILQHRWEDLRPDWQAYVADLRQMPARTRVRVRRVLAALTS